MYQWLRCSWNSQYILGGATDVDFDADVLVSNAEVAVEVVAGDKFSDVVVSVVGVVSKSVVALLPVVSDNVIERTYITFN